MNRPLHASDLGLVEAACLPAEELVLLAGKHLPQGYASAIVALFPYYTGEHTGRNISLYAVGPDYHTAAKAMLIEVAGQLARQYPGVRSRALVDASPIDEVATAHRCGLGDIGRNGLLIAPPWGQFVFIGCLLTDLDPAAIGLVHRHRPSACTGCGACLSACPTGALNAGEIDPDRCRSALTQKPGRLTQAECASIRAGGLVWGCDGCLLGCPHNAAPKPTPIEAFHERILPRLDAAALDALSDRAYLWRGLDTLRRNLALLGDDGSHTL